MCKKFLLPLMAILFLFSSNTEAAKVDFYREVIATNNFILKYKIISKSSSHTLKELEFKREPYSSPIIQDKTQQDDETIGKVMVFETYRYGIGKSHKNIYQAIFEEYHFGNLGLFKALEAIIPPERILAIGDNPQYKFVGAGSLENGIAYEDFTANVGERFFATRYYFENDKLIKISTINYSESENSFEKYIIEIVEFQTLTDNAN